MDVTPTRAVILFAKNVAGKGGFDSPAMSLDDWQDAFGEMQGIMSKVARARSEPA